MKLPQELDLDQMHNALGSHNGAGLAVEECVLGSVAQLSTLCKARALYVLLDSTRQGCLSLAQP